MMSFFSMLRTIDGDGYVLVHGRLMNTKMLSIYD